MASFLAELRLFLRNHKRLVLLPLILLALCIGLLVLMMGRRSELAPMIYTVGSSIDAIA